MSKQTAVDFLSERYNYITWMRNRDEISAGTADEWRAKFLKEAKEMEKQQISNAYETGAFEIQGTNKEVTNGDGLDYFEETYH